MMARSFLNSPPFTIRFLTLVLLFLANSAHAACIVYPPEDWEKSRSRWEGECSAGKAHGLGVLKELSIGQKVTRLLFGRAERGFVRIGVIDLDGNYIVGSFQDGKVVLSDQPQPNIDAFNAAAKAAKLVAARYREANNVASAKFYENKAAQLEQQMD